jgi:hypothetical protein
MTLSPGGMSGKVGCCRMRRAIGEENDRPPATSAGEYQTIVGLYEFGRGDARDGAGDGPPAVPGLDNQGENNSSNTFRTVSQVR